MRVAANRASACLVAMLFFAGCSDATPTVVDTVVAKPIDMSVADEGTTDSAQPKDDQLVALDQSLADASVVQCTLGTMYPGVAVIDPDNPVYEDAFNTQAQVEQKFASGKIANSKAYRGYKAAWKYPELLLCAFCACGCEDSPGHLSAVDCFKDMHGFG